MPGISRDNDTAGGDLVPSVTTVFANNEEIIVDRDTVVAHGHPENAINAGSNNVFAGASKKAVVNLGDLADCGHSATGSSDVFVGD